MLQGGNIGQSLGLDRKGLVGEARGVSGFTGYGAARLQRDLAGDVHGLGLIVGRIVNAHAPCGDRTVVLRPGVGGRGPFMRADVDDDVFCGHGQAVALVAFGKAAAACQEEVLRVGRIASRVVGQNGDRLPRGGTKRVVVEDPGGEGVQPGHIVFCAACTRQGHVTSRCDGIAVAALVVCVNIQIVAVLQGAAVVALPAIEVLRTGPRPGCWGKDAVPDGENASAIPYEAAAEGGILPQEAAVYRAAGDA